MGRNIVLITSLFFKPIFNYLGIIIDIHRFTNSKKKPMKKVTILLILLFGIIKAFGQNTIAPINLSSRYYKYESAIRPMKYTIYFYDWSNPIFFAQSPKPPYTGYGELSDSLSKIFQGKTFYAIGDDYYQIETWADYYYWLTKKHPHKFLRPELYEFYYLSGNDEKMISYLQTNCFYFSILRFDFRETSSSKRYIRMSTLDTHHGVNRTNQVSQRNVNQDVIYNMPVPTQTINTPTTITADE
jgi:hypothetical protein